MAKKRKGVKKSREESHQEEAAEKHSKLVYSSTKTLRKEAKVIKSFECQKIVRKIKTLKESIEETKSISSSENVSDESEKLATEKVQNKMRKLDEKLKNMKKFDIDDVVQAALIRLGIIDEADKKSQSSDDEIADDKFIKSTIETMIKHKRLSSAMESIREKFSEYNLWLSRREDWLANGGKRPSNRDDDERPRKKRGREVDVAGHDAGSGLFIASLSGNAMPEDGDAEMMGYEGYDEYGEEDYSISQPKKKKNRMGQRARKAKAMAIEAAKAGKVWNPQFSSNWRAKKRNEDSKPKIESASGLDKGKNIKVAEVANMGKDWKDEGKAHPSWAAREAQKAKSGLGIVAFAGKKITFD